MRDRGYYAEADRALMFVLSARVRSYGVRSHASLSALIGKWGFGSCASNTSYCIMVYLCFLPADATMTKWWTRFNTMLLSLAVRLDMMFSPMSSTLRILITIPDIAHLLTTYSVLVAGTKFPNMAYGKSALVPVIIRISSNLKYQHVTIDYNHDTNIQFISSFKYHCLKFRTVQILPN